MKKEEQYIRINRLEEKAERMFFQLRPFFPHFEGNLKVRRKYRKYLVISHQIHDYYHA